MRDLFDDRATRAMLLGEVKEPFDGPDWEFELKLDGIRALAYIDNGVLEIRNKRNIRIDPIYPELAGIHDNVRKR